ncbi:hypothetical protein TNCV_4202521 [Trichonephila clavipes]|uniref:Uncharacterized protein n=1 Tax=Trichonephila clavipes TaxID=2585209 RepID=A0A8X6SEH5_TRICX|nr:hypothetical protein TNCV_4202521 [Trichonephila clavipes]
MSFPHFRHGQHVMNMSHMNIELANIHFIYGLANSQRMVTASRSMTFLSAGNPNDTPRYHDILWVQCPFLGVRTCHPLLGFALRGGQGVGGGGGFLLRRRETDIQNSTLELCYPRGGEFLRKGVTNKQNSNQQAVSCVVAAITQSQRMVTASRSMTFLSAGNPNDTPRYHDILWVQCPFLGVGTCHPLLGFALKGGQGVGGGGGFLLRRRETDIQNSTLELCYPRGGEFLRKGVTNKQNSNQQAVSCVVAAITQVRILVTAPL